MNRLKAVMNENGRFVLVDRGTGVTVDDNQGHGYETPQKAYACRWWKNKNLERKPVMA